MISLKIGNEERQNGNIKNRWIAHQLQKRNGQAVCIKLVIREGDVNAGFSSGGCTKGLPGLSSPPNRKEQKLFELWDQKGLNGKDIKPGWLISFLDEYGKSI